MRHVSLVFFSEELLAALEKTAECANPEAPKDRLKGVMAFILLLLLSGLHKSGTSSLRFTVWSDIPVGAGLGSSAAYCASVCGALTRAAKVVPCGGGKQEGFCEPYCDTCKEKLNLWTYEGERVLHGNPSGIDNSIAIYGGALSFVRGKEQGKGITHIRMPVVPMVLTDTGVPRSTQKLVAGVGERKKEFPEVMGHVLNAMGEVSKKCMDLFENEKDQSALIAALNALIDINQGLLECCGVSHESIRSVKRVAQELGYHTKLTGAGGGGCTFTLVKNEENKSKLEQAIAKLGMRYFEVNIGGEGLSIKLLL